MKHNGLLVTILIIYAIIKAAAVQPNIWISRSVDMG